MQSCASKGTAITIAELYTAWNSMAVDFTHVDEYCSLTTVLLWLVLKNNVVCVQGSQQYSQAMFGEANPDGICRQDD